MNLQGIKDAAASIRLLAMDAVETSGTGHPGMALGCAEIAATLYGEILKHNPEDPAWIDRDRFVLSAGHGSILLYAVLHLAGYDLPLEEIGRLRRIGSLTPGHPEYGLTAGVETTTGPLGAGFATAVGMAMAERRLAARFNTAGDPVIDHYTYVLSGDGCLMEGVSAEAASLAGHLGLGKLIVFYDSNGVSIDGPTSITFTEDVRKRFEAQGWSTFEGSAHDPESIVELTRAARSDGDHPSLIVLNSVIGRGAASLEGNPKVHGSPLGAEAIAEAKRAYGIPETEQFYVLPEARRYFEERKAAQAESYERWRRSFGGWQKENPTLAAELRAHLDAGRPYYKDAVLPTYETGAVVSTRDAGGEVLRAYAKCVENLIGGSADLEHSNKTAMPEYGEMQRDNPLGRTIRFGVREHAMSSIVNGLALHGGVRPFAATLFVFIDYMRPPMRLAALMEIPTIYVLTHDSIFLGGDGPTHQPIEHLNSMRLVPNLEVYRPADARETALAWQLALESRDHPTAIVLSRQGLPVFDRPEQGWQEDARRGAYVARDSKETPELVLAATGSEVSMAMEAAERLSDKLKIRVVSIFSRETLLRQEREFRNRIIPPEARCIVVEAGAASGWEVLTGGDRGEIFSINRFGASGTGEEVAEALGFTLENLLELIEKKEQANATPGGGVRRSALGSSS